VTDGHQDPPQDLLSSGTAPARAGGKRALLAVVTIGLLAAGVAGGGAYAAARLSGGGAQPEDVLPREAFGFVKIDLDPAAGQKVAAYRFAKKFPDSGVRDQDSLQADLVGAFLGKEHKADYDAHVAPWLGKRAGVAFLAPPAGEGDQPVVTALGPGGDVTGLRLVARSTPSEPDVVAALQFTDREKAEVGLAGLADKVKDEGGKLRYAFAEDEDYVLLAEEQALADRAAGQQEHLSDNPEFDEGVEALDGDQIALGWVDVGAFWQAVPEQAQAGFQGEVDVDPSGLAVFGAHVEDDAVEVVGRTVRFSAGSSPEAQGFLDTVGRGEPSGLIEQLPANSIGAFSITGLGEGLTAVYDQVGKDLESNPDVQDVLESLDVRLPEDLGALLGDETAFSIGGDLSGDAGSGALRVATDEPERAVELLSRARDMVAEQDSVEASRIKVGTVDGGYAAAYGLGELALGDGKLGESEVFQRTLPDVDRSSATYYVDIARVIEQVDAFSTGSTEKPGRPQRSGKSPLTERERANLAPLQALGYTTTVDGDDLTFRLRLTAVE